MNGYRNFAYGRLLLLLVSPAILSVSAAYGEQRTPSGPQQSLSADYCENFSNVAADLRAKRQKEELEKLRQLIDSKLVELQARTAELRETITKRDEMLALASEELLKIYARMEPESAAKQLEKIDTRTAASVLRRLKPQLSSEILSAMDIKRASQLVQVIANENASIDGEKKS